MTMLKNAKKLQKNMTQDRRYLHQNAEVGFHLPKTCAYITKELKEMGYTPKVVGRCAITADIGRGKECFLLRADMDALPIKERSGEPFAATNGHMHACGHDLHTAMLLGAARLLKAEEGRLRRRVRLLFQPAEELLEGAKDCVEAGVLEGVTGGMMLHVLPSMPFPVGTAIVSAEGVSAPAADFFDWSVSGKGCHGSSPWQGVDALLIAAKTVAALETLSSREISPMTPATLTFGQFHAGNAANAIAERATLSGTIRAMDEKTRSFVKKRMEEIGKTTAKAFRGRVKITYNGGCPCLKNDGAVSSAVYALAQNTLGKERAILSSDLPKGGIGGSEDFAYIAEKIPAVMVGICAGGGGQAGGEPLHSPKVCFDEACMPYGAALLAAVSLSG